MTCLVCYPQLPWNRPSAQTFCRRASGPLVPTLNILGALVKLANLARFDGINANVFVNFYATEDLALKAKFDYAKLDFDDEDFTIDMWSIGGEAEYLLRDWFGGGSSVFVGGRYSEQEFENEFTIEQAQFFVGFRSYFVTGGSLANHHRTNTLDNTNTLLEKVPFAIAVDIID